MHIITTTRGIHFDIHVMDQPGLHILLNANDLQATAYPADVTLYSDDGGHTNALTLGGCTVGPIDYAGAKALAEWLAAELADHGIHWQRNCWNEHAA